MNTIVKGLKEGDKTVIRNLYSELLPKVTSWIIGKGGSKEDGYDLFQDALESIIIRIHKNTLPSEIDINAFIMQIAKNKWIDRVRRKKLDEKVRLAEDDRYQSESPWENELIAAEEEQRRYKLMKLTFSQLSPLCQQLLEMVMGEKKTKEIVDKLGFNNANTMYRRKFACMDSWKSLITNIRSKSTDL